MTRKTFSFNLKIISSEEENIGIMIGLTKQGWDGTYSSRNGVWYDAHDGGIYAHNSDPTKVVGKGKVGDTITFEQTPVITTIYINGNPLVSTTDNTEILLPTFYNSSSNVKIDVDVASKDRGNIIQKHWQWKL